MISVALTFAVGVLLGLTINHFLKLVHDQSGGAQTDQLKVARNEAGVAKLELARIQAREEGRLAGRAEALANYQIEIGRRYVLFVNGLPCLHPSEYVREELTECELDYEALLSLALGRAETAVLTEGVGIAVKVLAAKKAASPEDKGA